MITLYNSDCLEILKILPNNSIDLVLIDPPYEHTNGGFGHSSLGHRAAKLKSDIDFMSHSFDMGGGIWRVFTNLQNTKYAYILFK